MRIGGVEKGGIVKRCFLFLSVILLAGASIAWAHGDKKHVLGTVEKISADSVTVKTADGQSVEVKLVPETVFLKSGHAATWKELSAGDRVVIHATPKGAALEASEVKFGPSPAPAAKPQH
jgi:hypothetical protein